MPRRRKSPVKAVSKEKSDKAREKDRPRVTPPEPPPVPEPEVAPEPEPALDEVVEPEREIPEPPEIESMNPLSHIGGDEDVPIYNGHPEAPICWQYDGVIYTVPPKKIIGLPRGAVDHAVGNDNSGGPCLTAGLRRLYGLEKRFMGEAQKRSMSLVEFVMARNEALVRHADQVAGGVDSEALGGLDIPDNPFSEA
jgi:hypothetical protein